MADDGTGGQDPEDKGLSPRALQQVKEMVQDLIGATNRDNPVRREGRAVLENRLERDEKIGDQIEAAIERIHAKDAHAAKERERDETIAELKKKITQVPPKTSNKLAEIFFGKDPE